MKKIALLFSVALSLVLPAAAMAASPGVFNVVDYTTPQDAVNAAGTAGGGRVFFSQSVAVTAPIVVPGNVAIECASRGVVVSTNSPAADLFHLQGNNTTISNCGLAYSGTVMKTSGYLVNMTAWNSHLHNIDVAGGCWVCVRSAGIAHSIVQAIFNTSNVPVAANSGLIVSTSEILQLTSITGGSMPGNLYDFGIKLLTGAIDANGLELLLQRKPLWIAPGPGQSAFWRGTTAYLDNCSQVCALLQPTGGTIGVATMVGYEFGSIAGATPLNIDTSTFGGNVGSVTVSASDLYSYGASGSNAVNLMGSLGNIKFKDNDIGSNLNGGLVVQGGAAALSLMISGNTLHGAGAGLWMGAVIPNLRVHDNLFGGSPMSIGGNNPANFYNNL